MTQDLNTNTTFTVLGIAQDLVDVLAAGGITEAFPIQVMTIPDGLAGHDVLGKAQTGSGKTLAFGLPIVEELADAQPLHPKALVPGTDARTGTAGDQGSSTTGRVARLRPGHRLWRSVDDRTDRRARIRRGADHRHTGTAHRSDGAQQGPPRRRHGRLYRRSRPDGRHGLHAPGAQNHGQSSRGPPDVSVLGDPRLPGADPGRSLPDRSDQPRGRFRDQDHRDDVSSVPQGAPPRQGEDDGGPVAVGRTDAGVHQDQVGGGRRDQEA